MEPQLVESLLPKLPYANEALGLFAEAAACVARGDLMGAELLSAQIDDRPLRAHFYAVQEAFPQRLAELGTAVPVVSGDVTRTKERMPGVDVQRQVFAEDGWRCRWCGTRVVSVEASKTLARLLPSVWRHRRANDDCHGVTLCCGASLDHVLAHSYGGTNDRENLVTACWPCQFGRGDTPIETIGLSDPRERSPLVDDWDGCSGLR